VFSRLFDESVRAYEPTKQEEVEEKIKEVEEWNDTWEVSETRNFNPYIYKPHLFKLSLYKNNQDKKAYLNFDSDIEEEFLKLIENNKDKIEWWWQNGNEHMNLNFGIKYNGGSTFQPDFLVMFKDGRLGIFDTKASGDREDSNKLKAEALQKYIKEENNKKGKKLFGGLVIKNKDHFMINSDSDYESFKLSDSTIIKEKGKKYGTEKIGWQYFKI
jgi:type III restriction enzyme